MSNPVIHHPSSWRDPSGFIFESNGVLYRQVNVSFREHFDHFIESGCYDACTGKGMLLPHEEIDKNLTGSAAWYRTIRPQKIEFVSYPYEWSFDMLKDAALLTLGLLKEALRYNMILKDATPFNFQWHNGSLIFIDTLSFEKDDGKPWIAYRQFCETFLGPLLIMHYSGKQMPELMLAWPEGIPVATTSSLLPKRSRFSLHTYLHIHLHSRISRSQKESKSNPGNFSKSKMARLIGSLEVVLNNLRTPAHKSVWSGYYDEAKSRDEYLSAKKSIITSWIEKSGVKSIIDFGANEGAFSQIGAAMNIPTVASDMDTYCINNLYLRVKKEKLLKIQPMVLDLSYPSPAIGVNNEERFAFTQRARTDMALALALIHHLAIGKNIPFDKIASLFARNAHYLIIEFVPKTDQKIRLMLDRKKDIYTDYTEDNFTGAFETFFTIVEKQTIPGSGRILFLMKKNDR
jgi:hypothetical protein